MIEQEQTFMEQILSHIQTTFPSEWLSNLFEGEENSGVDISHPSNNEQYLSIDIFQDEVVISLFSESDRDILIDISAFNYAFSSEQSDEAINFLNYFFENGTTEN